MTYGLGAYKKTSVETAGREQILLMLYQAAIKHCKKAMEAIEEKDIVKKGESIGRLQDIIIELMNSLDFNVGGDIAKELSALYDYMLYSSTQANINIDKKPLEGVLSVLSTLYSGWVEAVKSLKTGTGTNASQSGEKKQDNLVISQEKLLCSLITITSQILKILAQDEYIDNFILEQRESLVYALKLSEKVDGPIGAAEKKTILNLQEQLEDLLKKKIHEQSLLIVDYTSRTKDLKKYNLKNVR